MNNPSDPRCVDTDIPAQSGQSTGECAAAELAEGLRGVLSALRDPDVDQFLVAWPPALHGRATAPRSVPVTRWLKAPLMDPPGFAAAFVTRLAGASARLAWSQTYDARQAGDAFLENYGYCELLGLQAAVASAHLAAGVLLLGPHTVYAAHWHEAEEIYVPLVGTASWWQGVQGWRLRPPGSVIRHARFEPHAMRTGVEPLLALYVWRSEDLAQKAQLVSRSGR